jgi:hypothetical protein
MAMMDAVRLIGAIGSDASLRREMVSCVSLNELTEYLFNRGFSFTPFELEEAVNHLHVKCATEENASSLMARAEWFNYLILTLSK